MSPRQHRALCEKLDIAPLGCICELQELDAGNGGALLWNRLTDQGWRVTLSTWPGQARAIVAREGSRAEVVHRTRYLALVDAAVWAVLGEEPEPWPKVGNWRRSDDKVVCS